MTFHKLSIRRKLALIIAAFIAILVVLATVAMLSLFAVNQRTAAVEQQWLVRAQILGQLRDHMSGFRGAEADLSLASDASAVRAAQVQASRDRRAIDDLQNQYASLAPANMRPDLARFNVAQSAYFAAHDAWIGAATSGVTSNSAQLRRVLHTRFEVAEAAIEHLVEANLDGAQTAARAASQLTRQSNLLVLSTSVLAVLLGLWLLVRVRRDIAQPLSSVAASLKDLAAGHRNVEVLELNRDDEIGEMARAVSVFRQHTQTLEDAYEATRAAQEAAQLLAQHDLLTGLPNRRGLASELQAAAFHAQHDAAVYMVLVIDLDRFKPVNDLQGRPVGDFVLNEVARRLRRAVRKRDTVARLGGDEFCVIAKADPGYRDGAILLATRLLDAIQIPILVGQQKIEVTASIGIASCPADGLDPESLLRAADIAMSRAKQEERGSYRFFELSMDKDMRAQAALEADLREAVQAGVIRPYYQPIIEMRDQRVCGFEILARWHHPQRGAVPPDIFIPLAEQLGLMPDLTTSILREACRDARQWGDDIHLSLNISPVQLKDLYLPAQLLPILSEEGFPSSRLEIEITENALVGDIQSAKSILGLFQDAGIRISLDDFGTGYSSLYHLRELKFDKVKIDKSFVQTMQRSNESEKIIDAILGLARSLGMATVAEGIEDTKTLAYLRAKACEFGHGYYFGEALSAAQTRERFVQGWPHIAVRS